jgi:hypothetical protein
MPGLSVVAFAPVIALIFSLPDLRLSSFVKHGIVVVGGVAITAALRGPNIPRDGCESIIWPAVGFFVTWGIAALIGVAAGTLILAIVAWTVKRLT